MAISKKAKVHGIIHTAATSAAGVGAGLAQIPTSDVLIITPIQASMIVGIALVHKRKIKDATATMLIGTFAAGMFGRAISQVLIGWIPWLGNVINASTAAALTEAVGWAAHKFFEELGDEPIDEDELVERAKGGRSE